MKLTLILTILLTQSAFAANLLLKCSIIGQDSAVMMKATIYGDSKTAFVQYGNFYHANGSSADYYENSPLTKWEQVDVVSFKEKVIDHEIQTQVVLSGPGLKAYAITNTNGNSGMIKADDIDEKFKSCGITKYE